MSVSPRYSEKNKDKIQSWCFFVRIPTNTYDKYGKMIYKQIRRSGFKTKKEAERAEREFLNSFDNATVEFHPNTICRHIINNLFEHMKNEGKYAKGTVRNYTGYYKNHLQKFDLVPISRITPEFIQAWRRELFKNNVSDHVYNGCVKLLKRAFNYAISLKQINTNPFVDLKAVSIAPKLRKRFSTAQLKEILDVCQSQMPEFYCIFVLATLSGMREGEYCALKTTDFMKGNFNFKAFIERQFTARELKNKTKTETSTRVVDISDKVNEIVQWHIQTFNIKEGDYLFRADKGGLIYAKWVERRFKKLLMLCGYEMDYCRVQDLRGQYVDIMHLCGTPVAYISRQVGHSDTKTTIKAYTQILNELPVEANKRMDEMIFGSQKEV